MQTLIVGLDAFDPTVFERLAAQGRVPNLARFLDIDGYRRFVIANPPQSEVSWTSIATGLNPGGHGIFDFVHRDPATYLPYVSLLPTKSGLAGTQFAPPSTASTIFDQAIRKGYPATVLWWPATFPARPESPVQTLPGLGTPDLLGRLGVGTLFTPDSGQADGKRKTTVEVFQQSGKGRYRGKLGGPARKKGSQTQEMALEVELDLTSEKTARLKVGEQVIELERGKWSPIFVVTFKAGLLYKLHGITRAILTQVDPEPRLYLLPLQIHPLHSPWRYASPQGFVKRTWEQCGPFLTLGWPQDTTGLEEGCIDDDQFLALCNSIVATREKVLHFQLDSFREGILASVFDSLDRIQHMFWRDRPDIIEAWYEKLDGIIGRVQHSLASKRLQAVNLIVVSDHGFTNFDFKVHLNRWLIDHGYLVAKADSGTGGLKDVDWSRSQAYAIGLNSIYVNQASRESQGIVQAEAIESLVRQLGDDLLTLKGPEGAAVVRRVYHNPEVIEGPLAAFGPDLLVGFSPGYRASAQTGLGGWEGVALEANRDHWGADHCIDPEMVPGVLFSNRGLQDFSSPSYRDFPVLAIGEKFASGGATPPPSMSAEDEKAIEERLKSLGYL